MGHGHLSLQTISLEKHKAKQHIMPVDMRVTWKDLPNSFTSTFGSCDDLDLYKTAETSSKLCSSKGIFILIYHYSQNPSDSCMLHVPTFR